MNCQNQTFLNMENDNIFHIIDQIKVLRVPGILAYKSLRGWSLENTRTVPLKVLHDNVIRAMFY